MHKGIMTMAAIAALAFLTACSSPTGRSAAQGAGIGGATGAAAGAITGGSAGKGALIGGAAGAAVGAASAQ
ncbi:hypothetical protein GCM10010082_00020 [Kushneria pakistanensis]|uniref:YMGG-like Gly-zipper domain-containing protein n=1 Tax=Kushneria pakistanensis TaxID=1508770 RepID=A0ABQ3F8N3_9GAMM|nr:YMGG-like glycine zipper-containing protein [Kushneria pakistanensis]GHC14102.1 hypothetical protein GCM10010082_00020 [Kushneria pakistanensis]